MDYNLKQLGSPQLDWNLIILYGIFATIFLIYEWHATKDKKEYKLTFIKYFGWFAGSVLFHTLVVHVFQLKENQIVNGILSGTLVLLMFNVNKHMIMDSNAYKKERRENIKQETKDIYTKEKDPFVESKLPKGDKSYG